MKYQLYGLAVLGASIAPAEPDSGREKPSVEVVAAAGRIDALVEAGLRRAGLQPNPPVDDATFLRRTYLAIAGRIPTVAEARRFLESGDRDRRGALVDSLLDSPAHQSRMFNFWADLLRVKSRLGNQLSGEPLIHWIKQSVIDNKPYDRFVAEMLTAEGPAHERGNGATGLLLRDRGMPLDSMANTVRVFLGTRLECAQCHDHPTDKWTQMEFFEMAAFNGGVQYRARANQLLGGTVQELRAEMRRERDTVGQRALNQLLRPASAAILGSGSGQTLLPRDYQYDDAPPGSPVRARVMFGQDPEIEYPEPERRNRRGRRGGSRRGQQRGRRGQLAELGTRAAFAGWMTSPDNPRFTTVIANRMWRLVMGRGLIEPVDNMMDDTQASNPELMRYLEELMVDLRYDLKEFQRVLYSTATYQRQATRAEVPADAAYHFPGPLLRRMTAEQVWDSLLSLVLADPEAGLADPGARAEPVYRRFEEIAGLDAQALRAEVDRQRLRYTDPEKFRQLQREARQAQRREQQRRQAELRAQAQPLLRQLNRASRAGDREQVAELESRLRDLGVDPRRRGRPARRLRDQGPLVRASELPSPAPDGHLLRQFGQSDREQIQASHAEANVPQVLTMLNGFVEDAVIGNPSAALSQAVSGATADADRVRAAFLGVLAREPADHERTMWVDDLEQHGDRGLADLVWTLTNSHEFRFIR